MPHGKPEYQELRRHRSRRGAGALLVTPGTECRLESKLHLVLAQLLTAHVTRENHSVILSLHSCCLNSPHFLGPRECVTRGAENPSESLRSSRQMGSSVRLCARGQGHCFLWWQHASHKAKGKQLAATSGKGFYYNQPPPRFNPNLSKCSRVSGISKKLHNLR